MENEKKNNHFTTDRKIRGVFALPLPFSYEHTGSEHTAHAGLQSATATAGSQRDTKTLLYL